MRNWVRTRAGVVTTGTAAILAGGAVWLAAVGGFGFHNAAVIAASSCTSSCTGSVTLTATAPPQTSSVVFKVDGSTVSTDESAPYSASWDTTAALDGSHDVVAVASGTGGSTSSATVTVSTSNGVSALGNVWVSTTGNDATGARSATQVALGSAQPFATLGAAWSAASAGDTIRVADGDYTSGCALSGDKTSDTTFVGSSNARFICLITIPAGNVHAVFDGLSIYQITDSTGGSFVTLKNGSITCTDSAPYTLYTPDNLCDSGFQFLTTDGVSNWTFQNEDIGPNYVSANCGNAPNENRLTVGASSILFENVTFHDARVADCVARGQSQQHAENVYFAVGPNGDTTGVTFDRCTFYNGANSGIVSATTGVPNGAGPDSTELMLTRVSGSGSWSGLTISNCLFYGAGAASILGNVDAQFTNGSVIEYNTMPKGLGTYECNIGNCPSGYTDLTFKGNVSQQSSGSCPDSTSAGRGAKYVYNVWYRIGTNNPTACGTNDGIFKNVGSTDVRATLFTDYLNNDFTLTAGSGAIGFVPTLQGCPSTDLAGTSRPSSNHATTCDAGSYENR